MLFPSQIKGNNAQRNTMADPNTKSTNQWVNYFRLLKSRMILMRYCHGILSVARWHCPDAYKKVDFIDISLLIHRLLKFKY